MWRDSDTIRRRFCPLHPFDGWRVATVIRRMVIRSPMAWREAPRHRRFSAGADFCAPLQKPC